MQIIKSKGNIVEKVVRDKAGKLIRARFFVFESHGRIKARLVDFVYVAEQIYLKGANFLLSITMSKVPFDIKKYIGISYVSPYVVLNNIYFSGSKPRAPTFV